MKFFQTIKERLCERGLVTKQYGYQPTIQENDDTSPTEKFACTHSKTGHILKVTVLGVECEFEKSPMCQVCAEQYLNKFSTLCASCKRPIFPGTSVGQAWKGASHPFTHLNFDCCATGTLYCGVWGDGRLITLHELNPEKYPEGTPTVVGHAFNTGEMVIENVG